jgi:glycosyltransferase involved in cell wall biosynthesis
MEKTANDLEKRQPMKIAMFGHKRIPSREGGIEIVVEELSTRMVMLGYEVICYNRSGHHVSGKEFDIAFSDKEYNGGKLVQVFTINRKGLAALTSSFFASLKASFSSAKIVHIHAEGPAAMSWIPKLFGKRVIVTVHGLDWQRAKWGRFATWYLKHGEKTAVKYADEIVVLSKDVQDYFKDVYNRQTVFIPNGVNRPNLREAKLITEKYGLEKNGFILFLARLVPEKGPQYLINAFKNTKTDKKLVIAGGTSDSDEFVNELKEMASTDDRIIFTGFVQGNLLDELYSNAYVYVLPSDMEGMSLSLLEGMSYGNCCLISGIAENTEVVEDKAVVFKKGDVHNLEEKLQMLCDDESIVEKYRSAAADYICQKYNWDDIVQRTLKLYGKG